MTKRNQMKTILTAGVVAGMLGAGAARAEISEANLEVILGNHTDPWTVQYHVPFFTERLPEVTGGKITARTNAYTQLGLCGYEIMNLLKLGTNDVSWMTVGYMGGDAPITEGLELPGLTNDYNVLFKLQEAYTDTFDKTLREVYNSKLIFWSQQSSLQAFCNLTDAEAANFTVDVFKGKKVRVHSTPYSDLVEGLGGTPVTMPFTDVVPALERGVIDCAMTTPQPAYGYKFGQVVSHVIMMNAGFATHSFAMNLDTWNGLNAETQALLTQEFDKLEAEMRDYAVSSQADSANCLASGPCGWGEPAGMTPLQLSAEDQAKVKKVVEDVVLARFAARCGAACAEEWNGIASDLLGMTMKAN